MAGITWPQLSKAALPNSRVSAEKPERLLLSLLSFSIQSSGSNLPYWPFKNSFPWKIPRIHRFLSQWVNFWWPTCKTTPQSWSSSLNLDSQMRMKRCLSLPRIWAIYIYVCVYFYPKTLNCKIPKYFYMSIGSVGHIKFSVTLYSNAATEGGNLLKCFFWVFPLSEKIWELI